MQIPYRKPGKYSNQKQDPIITKEKFLELEQELSNLKRKKIGAAEEVARLAELGDFSENAEYQHAKGRLRGINNAILRIQKQIDQAEVIEEKPTDLVQVGHSVTVKCGGKIKTFKILGSSETDPGAGIISYTSPLGKELLGHEVGDVVGLKDKEYEIIKIEN